MPRWSIYATTGHLLDVAFSMRDAFSLSLMFSEDHTVIVRDELTGRSVTLKNGRVL